MSAFVSIRLLITSADIIIFTITSTLVVDVEYLGIGVSIRPSRYRAVFVYSMNNKAIASRLVFAAVAITPVRLNETN